MRKRRMEYKERKEGRIDGKLAPKGHKRRPFQVTEQSTSLQLVYDDMKCLCRLCRVTALQKGPRHARLGPRVSDGEW